jgi:uncharacterized protein YprB with RNaseH-like and TPR domain
MLKKVNLDRVLFLDIETVSQYKSFNDLDEKGAALYDAKTKFIQSREELTPEQAYDKAGIYAEFGKIVCISCGFVQSNGREKSVRMKSFYGDDEEKLLLEFCDMLNGHYNSSSHILCGHNAKEFDFPFIARRLLIHGIDLPHALNIAGKKPWEIPHLDTMELWKFGDFKHYTSMSLLCHIFNVPTPKDDISGADVGRVYWEDGDLERIMIYCQKDVVALIQLFLKFRGEQLIDEEYIFLP